jgi:hypothetical protein
LDNRRNVPRRGGFCMQPRHSRPPLIGADEASLNGHLMTSIAFVARTGAPFARLTQAPPDITAGHHDGDGTG